jgi:hypothetical protein
MYRSLDLDKCPQRLVCEFGSFVLPANFTQVPTAKTLTAYIVEQAVPKGKARKMLRQIEKAFWLGSSGSNHCSAYKCQPAFKMYDSGTSSYSNTNEARNHRNTTKTTSAPAFENNYSNQAHVPVDSQYPDLNQEGGDKDYNQQHYNSQYLTDAQPQENEIHSASSNNYYKMFGTPTIKS